MFTLLFIMMLASATAAWFLIQRLQDKPWTQHGVLPGSQDTDGLTSSGPKVGLWAFMGVVCSVFAVFTGAYFMRMDTTHGGIASGMMQAWMPINEPPILWFNTAVLIVTSVLLEWARRSFGPDSVARSRTLLATASILTLIFLSGQVWAWQLVSTDIIATMGQVDRSNAAYAFFVVLTTVHGLHLLGGLFVLTRAVARLNQDFDATNLIAIGAVRQTIQLCATYWHFLLLVWFALFLILLST